MTGAHTAPPRRRPARGRWLFGGVNERMLVIILLATLPMAALSAVTAWQNYGAVRMHNVVQTRDLRDHIIERSRTQIEVATNVLDRLAERQKTMSDSGCADMLRFVVSLDVLRSTRLSILDNHHGILCSEASYGMAADPGLTAIALPPAGQMAILPADVQPLTLDIVSRPAEAVEQAAGPGLLVAQIEIGWWSASGPGPHQRVLGIDGGRTRVWMRFADGEVRALCGDCGWAPPPATMWPSRDAVTTEGVSSQQQDYASGRIANGVDLLVVTLPGTSDAQALAAFFLRVIEIVLILGAALLLVVVAANLAIVAPIDELTRAVDRWRHGGAFQRSRIALMPAELRRLWEAFGSATEALTRHEAELAAAEVKQGLLIKEIHHRVKNNLQIIASLLNLQANRIKQPDSKAEFASARDRVRALATLHRHLYQEGEPETMGLRGFIEELCAQLFQAMGERAVGATGERAVGATGERAVGATGEHVAGETGERVAGVTRERAGRATSGRIRLEVAVPDIEMPADQAVPIALIITEAVSNAVKYAFPPGRSGRIALSLTEIGAEAAPDGIERLRLVIADDGIGFPEGRAETESGVRDGLGIQLIRGFARQLGATLDVVQDQGTTYTVDIPRHLASQGVRL